MASQTLDNIRATNDAAELPVLRPLIGSDKLEIIEAAQELGTFEISSMDDSGLLHAVHAAQSRDPRETGGGARGRGGFSG
ncbi:MAG: hypothetical protein ACLTDR_07215 [Adlercreutzia equolifaciens]